MGGPGREGGPALGGGRPLIVFSETTWHLRILLFLYNFRQERPDSSTAASILKMEEPEMDKSESVPGRSLLAVYSF